MKIATHTERKYGGKGRNGHVHLPVYPFIQYQQRVHALTCFSHSCLISFSSIRETFKFVQKYESNALYTFDLNAQ